MKVNSSNLSYDPPRQAVKLNASKWFGGMLIAFVISPVLLLWFVFKVPTVKMKRIAITLFCVAYAVTMKLYDAADGARHIARVEGYYLNMGFSQFLGELWQIFAFQGTPASVFDPYLHVLAFIAGGILQQPLAFFALAGSVFGWFFSGTVLIALRHVTLTRLNYALVFLVALALLMRGIQDIQAVRMWTGMWIVLFGVFSYCIDKRKSGLITILFAPAVHFAYLAIVPVVLAALFFRKQRKIIAWVFLATAVLSFDLRPATMVDFESSELLESRASYVKEDSDVSAFSEFASRAQSTSLHNAATRAGIPKIGYSLLAAVILLSGFTRGLPTRHKDILFVSIAVLAFSNLSFGIPALSGRTTLIAATSLLLAYIFVRTSLGQRHFAVAGWQSTLYKYGSNTSFLFMFPMLLFALSSLTHIFSMYMFAFPFLAILDPEANLSLKEFMFLRFL